MARAPEPWGWTGTGRGQRSGGLLPLPGNGGGPDLPTILPAALGALPFRAFPLPKEHTKPFCAVALMDRPSGAFAQRKSK